MLRRLSLLTSILLASLSNMQAAAVDEAPVLHFQHWTTLGSQQLMDRAARFMAADKADSAMILYNVVANRYDAQHPAAPECSLAVAAMARIGDLYRNEFFNYPRAYSFLSRAQQLAAKHHLGGEDAYASTALALLYETETNTTDQPELTDTVVSLLHHALATALEVKDWNRALTAAYNMAICGYGQGRTADVATDLETFLNTDMPVDKQRLAYVKHFCQGILHMADKRFDEALDCFELMRQNSEPGNAIHQQSYWANCAEVYYRKGQIAKAMDYMNRIKAQVEKDGNRYDLMQVYNEFCTYYAAMGNETAARQARLDYLEMKAQVQNTDRLKQIKDMRFINQIDSMNVELQQLQQDRRLQQGRLLLVSIAAAIVCLALVLLCRAYRQLNRSHQALYRKNLELLRREEETTPHPTPITPHPSPKYQSNQLSPDDTDRIYFKVRQAMTDTAMICDRDFSLRQLAEAVGERPRDVSQVINSRAGMNFHTFVSEYRVKEACRRISEQAAYETMTIEALAESVGILSRSNFAVAFKRTTGLNPSEYIRQAKTNAKD